MPKGIIDQSKQVRFSSTNQPSPEAKRQGKLRKKHLRELAEAILTAEMEVKALELSKELGIVLSIEELSISICLMLKQIEKAWLKGDTAAFNAVMDRLHGKPKQETNNVHQFDLSQRRGLKWADDE